MDNGGGDETGWLQSKYLVQESKVLIEHKTKIATRIASSTNYSELY